jgi:DNA helicase-2/ATP-dependent DNA helicase PcrA
VTLEDFLNDVSLQSDQDGLNSNFISVMSVHASKGLEFDMVFVVGFEEGFFPLLGEDNDMEEERRLAYVAFTRAKDKLTIAYSKFRLFHGKRSEIDKSRFLADAGLVKGKLIIDKKTMYKKGDIVKHKVFGIGRVLGTQKSGSNFKLNINFGGQRREILSSFVEKIS